MIRLTRCVAFVATCALSCTLLACSQTTMPTFKTISAQEALSLMQMQPEPLVLDVREPVEYDRGRIPGAENLPLSQLEKSGVPSEMSQKDQTILIYCRSGRRSKIAAEIFTKAGFTKVYDFGGIESWPYRMTR